MTDYDPELEGETVKEVREAAKFDLVVEFESGRVLHVYDAKWRVSDPDKQLDTDP